jgi:hypothetical protein
LLAACSGEQGAHGDCRVSVLGVRCLGHLANFAYSSR